MTTTSSYGNRLIGLQVLRAVAALMVVFHHARWSVPGSEFLPHVGEAGVDVFFIISGFVMAYTTAAIHDDAGFQARGLAARNFFANRILRVVPLYLLALAWTIHKGYGSRFTGVDILEDIFFIPHVSKESPDFLSPIVRQGWSLDYEMFFYGLFAISMMFGSARRRVLIAGLAALVGIGAGLALQHGIPASDETLRWYPAQHNVAFVMSRFYTNNIMIEFCLGVALEAVFRRYGFPAWPRWVFGSLVLVGFGALAALHTHQWPRGLTQGVPAALIVWAAIPACAGLRLNLLESIGDASYSIYLFHWASFALLSPLMARFGTHGLGMGFVSLLVFVHVFVGTVVGVVIHRKVEKPMTRWLKRSFGHKPSKGSLAAASP